MLSAPLSPLPFGTAPNGEPVSLITLQNGILSCQILTYGATVRSLYVPDKSGVPTDIVLGYDTLEEYASQGGYFGAIVGRFANRIEKGQFSLNGKSYALSVNDGQNHLHGGTVGFSHQVWKIDKLASDSAELSLKSRDGEEGYPGDMEVRVIYALEGASLAIRYTALSTEDTPCNLTSHCYFNLAGHKSGPVFDQLLVIHAQGYTPNNSENIPLGPIDPVENTPMDFRTPTEIGARIHDDFLQLRQAGGYDHNYVLEGAQHTLRPAAQAWCRETGISMEVHTTMPGMQLYTGNCIPTQLPGKEQAVYAPYHAFCLETQYYPNSPNNPAYPSPILKKGQRYNHTTRFEFKVGELPS